MFGASIPRRPSESRSLNSKTTIANFRASAWPKGTGEIVVQNGASLYLVDLATSQSKAVAITVPVIDRTSPQKCRCRELYQRHSSIAQCKTDRCRSRGDIWTVPVKNGSPRNLTEPVAWRNATQAGVRMVNPLPFSPTKLVNTNSM